MSTTGTNTRVGRPVIPAPGAGSTVRYGDVQTPDETSNDAPDNIKWDSEPPNPAGGTWKGFNGSGFKQPPSRR